jgi:hypothetical protein
MFIISSRIGVDQNFVAAFRLAEIKYAEYMPTYFVQNKNTATNEVDAVSDHTRFSYSNLCTP